MSSKYVLVTGGAGYIASHVIIQLYAAGYKVVTIDNVKNETGKNDEPQSIVRVKKLVNDNFAFYNCNLIDIQSIRKVFQSHEFICVIHVAGLKEVGESVTIPLDYYSNNLIGSINLLKIMEEFSTKSIIFSSSATVYGSPSYLPIDEKHPVGNCKSPFAKSKFYIESIIKDIVDSDKTWKAIILRYFNAIGAHESGLIGQDYLGQPKNLMPYICQVAHGRRSYVKIFGQDYNTDDGTGIRDYIHVMDLADGHVQALEALNFGCKIYNLGTGRGYSVLEMVKEMERACGKKIEYKFLERRIGDVQACYADASLAKKELNWEAKRNLEDMCKDFWKWTDMNPNGYS